jgi:hypothetical protein
MAFEMQRVIYLLESYGFTDVLIPFFLIFTILYATLSYSKMFGEKKQVNVMISLLISLMVVIPHVTRSYPQNLDVVNIINQAVPQVMILVIAIVMFMVLVGMFGKKLSVGPIFGLIVLLSVIVLVYIFGSSAGWFGSARLDGWLTEDLKMLIVIVIVFGLVIAFLTGGLGGKSAGETLIKSFTKSFE